MHVRRRDGPSGQVAGSPAGGDVRRPGVSVAAAFALGGIALWSTNAVAAASALDTLELPMVLLLQFASATLALTVAHSVATRRPPRGVEDTEAGADGRADRLRVATVGLFGFAGTVILQYVAFDTAPIMEANVIAYGWPMFAALWLAFVLRTPGTVLGVGLAVVGFVGVFLMTVGRGGGEDDASHAGFGYVAALLSAVCMALYSLAAGRLRTPCDRADAARRAGRNGDRGRVGGGGGHGPEPAGLLAGHDLRGPRPVCRGLSAVEHRHAPQRGAAGSAGLRNPAAVHAGPAAGGRTLRRAEGRDRLVPGPAARWACWSATGCGASSPPRDVAGPAAVPREVFETAPPRRAGLRRLSLGGRSRDSRRRRTGGRPTSRSGRRG